jgi:5'(3')-deoxyribonucleotidase
MYNVGMDMDGVLHQFDKVFNKLYVEYGGEPQAFDEGVDFGQMEQSITSQVWLDPRLFRVGEPYADAVEMMNTLRYIEGVHVFIVTSFGRNPEIHVPGKWGWLQEHMPWVNSRDFITIADKWLLQVDMLVEDFHGNILKWQKANPTGDPVLIHRPWNASKADKLERRGVHVLRDGVQSVPELVCALAEKKVKGEQNA